MTPAGGGAERPAIVWLRDDLRLSDNPALRHAVDSGRPVIVVYLLDEKSEEIRPLGAARRWWLHHSLESLAASLDQRGGSLVLRHGAAEKVLPALVRETDAAAITWNRRYGAPREIDARLKERFRADGLEVDSFQANLLVEPWTLRTASGGPYRVYTPFWTAARSMPFREELEAPRHIDGALADTDVLSDWRLLPTAPDWAAGLRETWTPGERGARRRLESFIDDELADYHRRDEPAVEATSRLSPHLSFGEISPLQIWNRMQGAVPVAAKKNVAKFLSEVGWREFNHNILFHFTALHTDNYRPDFDAFPWSEPDPTELAAWQQGRTGIPLVDAGMRELWHTGYMHNRVRMVTASFLIKNLLVDWRVGERWFWDTLVDADEANNPSNWQWVAGSGADAAPYFRVFNPELQAKKFDPRNEYIARWVPELGTPEYPEPIVDLKETRRHALEAYEVTRKTIR